MNAQAEEEAALRLLEEEGARAPAEGVQVAVLIAMPSPRSSQFHSEQQHCILAENGIEQAGNEHGSVQGNGAALELSIANVRPARLLEQLDQG